MSNTEQMAKIRAKLREATKEDYEELPQDKFPQWYADKCNEVINKVTNIGFTLTKKTKMYHTNKINLTVPSWLEWLLGKRTTKATSDAQPFLMTQYSYFSYAKYPKYYVYIIPFGNMNTKTVRLFWTTAKKNKDYEGSEEPLAHNNISKGNRSGCPEGPYDFNNGTWENDLKSFIEHLEHFKNGKIINPIDVEESILGDIGRATTRKPKYGPSEIISKTDQDNINSISNMMVELKCDFRPGDVEPTPIMRDWWGFGPKRSSDCLGWSGIVQHPIDKNKSITLEYYGKAEVFGNNYDRSDYPKLYWYENEVDKTVDARPISHFNTNRRALKNYLIDNDYSLD